MLCRNKNRERYLIVKLKNQSYEKDHLSYRNGSVYRDGSCADYTLNPLWNWAETPANQLIVIRSQAELADFIFPNDKLPEDIDFEKNTLLLVAGQATNGIESVKKNFVKADAQYIYSVTFLLNDTTEAPKWRVAQLVPFVPSEAKISLDLEIN